MAQLVARLEGTVISSYVKTYQEFTDDSGQTRPGGAYSVVWLMIGPNVEPMPIRKVPEPLPVSGDKFACFARQSGQNIVFEGPAPALKG